MQHGSNIHATVGIEVGTITVGEGTTLIAGAGISLEKIKDEGTIAGGDYGVDNAGNIWKYSRRYTTLKES